MSKPPLVLLHGVGLDHTVWEPLEAILADRFEVLAPDLPGHGAAPGVAEGVTLADLAREVAAVVPNRAHLIGFSLGALVAQHLAIHRPELVATLTSVSSVCRRTDVERAAVLDRLAVAERDLGASTSASIDRWFAGTDVAPEWVERTRATLAANDQDSFLRCYRVFATGDAEVGPDLGRISVPSLAITGQEDPGSTPEMTHRLAAAIPGCRAEVVPHTRHMLPLERPGALAAAITALIGDQIHA
ncbi:MAG TPA: alpha/beta hydrolase [Nocardioides sp.]|uniref:alpha/beta fold hydrolase n=1 Tax=Nocardioides sp. TaxID=35761 RepID=UPI002EDB00EB